MELEIIVKGEANIGKSTIAREISECLARNGFDVQNGDFDEILFPVDSSTQIRRMLGVLNKGVKIRVDTEQLPRQSKFKRVTTNVVGEVFEIDTDVVII